MAATRMGALYRGSAARKQVAARRTAGDSSDQAAAAPEAGPGEEDLLAATKLEARVRGRAARAEAARRRAAGESKEAVAAAEAEAAAEELVELGLVLANRGLLVAVDSEDRDFRGGVEALGSAGAELATTESSSSSSMPWRPSHLLSSLAKERLWRG